MNKYFVCVIGVNVILGKGLYDNGFLCDIVVYVMYGLILKGSGFVMEVYLVFDVVVEKIEC